MPIALMLQANTRALLSGSARVAVWNELVELEALLVARARGAFLVRWFGTGFPLNGSRLRIAIANLPALRARYLALEAQTRTPEGEGLDIVQPLASLFGGVAGTFLDPLVLLTVLVSGAFKSIWRILTLVGGLLLGPLGAALISLAGPLLLAPLLFSSPKELVEGYPLALAVGALLPPLAAFFGALDTNFEAIFGSLLDLAALLGIGDAPSPPGVGLETATKILEGIAPIADQLAVFVPLLFGGLALLLVRVGPLLEPISLVLPAFLRFVVSAVEALGAMFTDIVDGLGLLFDDGKGALSVVGRSFRILSKAFGDLGKPFSALFDPLDLVVKDRKSEIAGVFLIFIGEAVVKIKETVVGHPQIAHLIDLVEVIKKLTLDILRALNGMVRAAVGKIGTEVAGPLGGIYATDLYDRLIKKITAPSTKPGFFEKILAKIKAFAISHLEQAIPDHKAIIARLTPPLTIAEAFPEKNFSEKEPTVPAELPERHSVFDAERAALLRAARTGSQQAADARERRLRGFLFDVVAKLLPENVAPHLASLRGFLQTLDREIDRGKAERELPVRTPPDPAKLRTAVRKIRLRVRGAATAQTERWAADLKSMLMTQEYPSPLAVSSSVGADLRVRPASQGAHPGAPLQKSGAR